MSLIEIAFIVSALTAGLVLVLVGFAAVKRRAALREEEARRESEWRRYKDSLLRRREVEAQQARRLETFEEWARRTHPQGKQAFPTEQEKAAQRQATEAFRRRCAPLPSPASAPYNVVDEDALHARNMLLFMQLRAAGQNAHLSNLVQPTWTGDGGSFSGGGASGSFDSPAPDTSTSSDSGSCDSSSSDTSSGSCGGASEP